MCIVKVMGEPYNKAGDIKRVINYAIKPSHCICGLYGATGMIVGTVDEMTCSMKNVKKDFEKCEDRQVLHIIISFDDETEAWITPEIAYVVGYKFVAEFFYGYQVVFGVHDNTDNLHLHLVINSVSYVTGLKCGIAKNQPKVMEYTINRLLEEYKATRIESFM